MHIWNIHMEIRLPTSKTRQESAHRRTNYFPLKTIVIMRKERWQKVK